MKTDETWKRSGRNITIALFLVAAILLLGLNLPRLGLDNLIQALPLLPAALLFAPDWGYAILLIGVVGFGWGITRTVLAIWVLRQPRTKLAPTPVGI